MAPFGYMTDFDTSVPFDSSAPSSAGFASNGTNLLDPLETENLDHFFQQGPTAWNPKDPFDTWAYNAPPPQNVHQVSTMPDQSHIQRAYPYDHPFSDPPATSPLGVPFGSLNDINNGAQALSPLFHQTQGLRLDRGRYSQPNPSAMARPVSRSDASHISPIAATTTYGNVPMIATSQGPMHEQIGALLPFHAQEGSVDAQLASQMIRVPVDMVTAQMGHRPQYVKKPYRYGTDSRFNASGYAAPVPEAEQVATDRLKSHIMHNLNPSPYMPPPPPLDRDRSSSVVVKHDDDGEEDADLGSSSSYGEDNQDDNRPTKRRKRSSSSKKAAGMRTNKSRKTSVVDQPDDSNGKRRASSAAQKPRENLSEAQKRANHIYSEQKRRNQIRDGFEDLNDLVPIIRNAGLNKSGILNGTADYLEDLLAKRERLVSMLRAHGAT